MPDDRKCRVCGCTETTPCCDRNGFPCSWVADDLCSACLDQDAWMRVMPETAVVCALALGDAIREFEEMNQLSLNEEQQRIVTYFFGRGFLAAASDFFEDPGVEEAPSLLLPGKDF